MVLKKLKINLDQPLWLINVPGDCKHLFEGVTIKEKLSGKKTVGQLILFAIDSGVLTRYMPIINDYVSYDTLFWIAYPKKSGAIVSDMILMKAWDIVFRSGFRGQSSVSVNDDWSGLRVTNAPKKESTIGDLPLAERKVEGIDFVNRTVQLPADALAVMKKHPGMEAFFYAMAFTHKKEHIEAIVQAKKPVTRTRRIEKMAEMLLEKMTSPKPRP